MMGRPQTIQIYLPHGDPRGMRFAEITTRIVRVIEVPRSDLSRFFALPEARQVGIYFLVGDSDEASLPKLYIGQSGELVERIRDHNRKKDYWSRAFVVVSMTNSLTQTHALFLEWFAIEAAKAAGRYALENGNGGSRPYTPAPMEADCREVHETAATLLATLGQPVFEALTVNAARGEGVDAPQTGRELFICTSSYAEAKGYYTNEGFVVIAGSSARVGFTPSAKGGGAERYQARLLEAGVLVEQDAARYRFARDHLFSSPSMAAAVVQGRHINGWQEWRTSAGDTLDARVRQMA